MNRTHSLTRRLPASAPGKLATRAAALAVAVVAAAGVTTAAGSTTPRVTSSFSFKLVPAAGIAACLPKASGHVTITTGSLNDTMVVTVTGMPAKAGFDLFVIQQPAAPFGVSWYQTDVQANSSGTGSATVRGVFDSETFSVSPGGPPRSLPPTSTTWACGSTIPTSRSSWAASQAPRHRPSPPSTVNRTRASRC